jgi:hypothetical protein
MAEKVYKLDLWKLLDNISTKNADYYNTFSDDNIKEFQPYVIQRWLTGMNDGSMRSAKQIHMLNAISNRYIFELGKHKKLLYNLLTIGCVGSKARYKFNKTKKKNGGKMPIATKIIQGIYGYNYKDAEEAIVVLTDATIVEMAESLGYQDKEIKDLKKELKTKRPTG